MSLPLPDAADGLYAAVVGILGIVLSWWLNRRGDRPARKDALMRLADAVRSELRRAYEGQITDLRKRLDDRDSDCDAKDIEIARLNRLLNRQRGGHD